MSKKNILGAIIIGILSWTGCGDDVKNTSETPTDAECLKESDCESGVCLSNGKCAVVVEEGEACNSKKVCAKGFSCQDGTCVAGGSTDPKPQDCDPATLPDEEDFDGDGILNIIEKNSKVGLDPCKADTDEDGVKDSNEDLNRNGEFEPELGETNPKDDADKRDPDSPEGKIVAASCSADAVLGEGKTGHYNRFHVAKVANVKYYPDTESAETNVLRFETDKVVGFFGSDASITGTGEELLKSVMEESSFTENSNFAASVPLESWIEKGYKASLQRVPNYAIDRYKYAIVTNGKSLQELADAIAKKFDAGSTEKYSGTLKCEGAATLYLARSVYKKGSIYSGAIVCDSDIKASPNAALMDDVLSGTLVFPGKALDDHGADKSADAYKDLVCQVKDYGNESGKVDMLWVIDNSGSMADELDKLSQTMPLFSSTVKNYGVDLRMAVTTTDAYLLDEDPTAYKAYDEKNNYKIVLDDNTYLNGIGLRQDSHDYKEARGFLNIVKDGEINETNQKAIQSYILDNSTCHNPNLAGKNVCGLGFEDGLKSGAFALSRIAVDVKADKAPDYYSAEDRSNWKTIKDIINGVTEGDADKQAQVSLRNEKKALLYVVWVTDEESRQFKEEPIVYNPVDSKTTNPLFEQSTGAICRTGYKLDKGKMKTGAVKDLKDSDCNPSMYDKLQQLIAKGTLTEDSSMEEIEAAYPEYANMLKYYIKQYQNFAQDREVVGFALVGDIGRAQGGFCKELATCLESDCTKKDTDGSCLECKNWDYHDAAATVGANYGLSYIHMARFLSSYYPDAPEKATKEGGKASICATDYNGTVTAIAEDFAGTLGSHPLEGYPIASSIRASIIHDGVVKELTRNATTDGWAYDASQNAITFKGVKDAKGTDKIAITYAIWNASE